MVISDQTSAVLDQGAVVSKRWFLAMDFLMVAHRVLELRWKNEGRQLLARGSFDVLVDSDSEP